MTHTNHQTTIPMRLIQKLLFASLVAASQWTLAAPTACPIHFLDGQAPDILIPTLSQRLYFRCYGGYGLATSGITKTGIWSAEHLTRDSILAAHHVSRVNDFRADDSIPAADRAELADYAGSGRLFLDRGHLAPSGDAPSAQLQDLTYLLANIVPQSHSNNAGIWEAVESATRFLAERDGDIYVVTGPAFVGSQLRRIGSGVDVPTHMWKAIYSPARGAAVFVTLNAPGNGYALLSVADFSHFWGIDPFPGLPAALRTRVPHLPRPRMDGQYLDPHALTELAAVDAGAPEESAGGESSRKTALGSLSRAIVHSLH